jgi:general secretion pathway protein M
MRILKNIAMKLSRRERTAIWTGIVFVCLFVLLRFAVFPFVDQRERLVRSLEANVKNLEEIRILKSEYEALNRRADTSKFRFEKRSKGFTLFSFLDMLAGEVGIKENIAYMKPSTTVQKESVYKISLVEMKLTGITMEQMTQFLHKIETSNNMVSVKRLSLTKPDETQQRLNAVLQVQTLEV